MSTIDVNINETRQINARLIPLRNDVGGAVTQVARINSEIDQRILNRNNLRRRINDTHNTIAAVESDLEQLNRIIAEILHRYETTDQDLLARMPILDLLGISNIMMPPFGRVVRENSLDVKTGIELAKAAIDGASISSFASDLAALGRVKPEALEALRIRDLVMGTKKIPTSDFSKFLGGAGLALATISSGIKVADGIQRRIEAGYSPSAVIGRAVVETGQEALAVYSSKKIIASSALTGAKWGAALGPKGALVGGVIGGAAGWVAARGTSYAIRNPQSVARSVSAGVTVAANAVGNVGRSVVATATSIGRGVATGAENVGRNITSGISNMASGLRRGLGF